MWVSERDGWRHVYSVSRDGKDVKCITPGNYDLIGAELVDAANGWLYFSASPDNATQKYLFRTRLDGSGKAERLSPADQSGTHNYTISPRGGICDHTYSAFTKVPVTDVVRFPQHTVVRTMFDNQALQERIAKLKPVGQEFFRVNIGEGVELDGWMMKPPDFDPDK
ncbi:MAG: DPP IV N-terminal domain-containing protein [Blastocatellia bacterium]